MIVQAETVLRWRGNSWSAIWGYRSRGRWRGGRPRVSSEVRHLITQMARENFLWSLGGRSRQASYEKRGRRRIKRKAAAFADRDRSRIGAVESPLRSMVRGVQR